MFALSVVACVFLSQMVTAIPYDTDYDQAFTFSCDTGEYIKMIESVHDNNFEDRIFKFTCADLAVSYPENTMGACEWSNYVNDWDALFEYQCPNNEIITGISSYHDNGKEDRRFKFQCCHPGSLVTHSCEYTSYLNSYDGILSYRVPDGFIIRGVNSVHDNGKEDRLYKFDICKLGALAG